MAKEGLSIDRACRHAGIARRSYYYRSTPRSVRKVDPGLEASIKETCAARPLYGYRRVTAMVKRKGYVANRKRVRRIMKETGLLHDAPPKRPHWQVHKGSQIAEMPNAYWQTDMTKIWCGVDGWGYLFNVVDTCDRAWAGYCFSVFCSTTESLQSLESALANRAPQTMRITGLTIGTDGGSQYTSRRFEEALALGGIAHKVSRKNTPEDNAVVEAFHKSVKTEYIWPYEFESFQQAAEVIAKAFKDYNEERIHSSLGYKTPREFFAEVMGKGLNILPVKCEQV
jgi:putative transposase